MWSIVFNHPLQYLGASFTRGLVGKQYSVVLGNGVLLTLHLSNRYRGVALLNNLIEPVRYSMHVLHTVIRGRPGIHFHEAFRVNRHTIERSAGGF